jgi:hypothetical protein
MPDALGASPFVPLVATFCLALAACEKGPSPIPPAASASALGAPLPAQSASAPVVRAAPPDLDVEALRQRLGCSAGKAKHACSILAEFAQAGRWSGETPSGEGRWLGDAYTLAKESEKREIVILVAKRAGTSQIGPSDLPIRVTLGSLPGSTWRDAAKLIRALASSSNVSKSNPAVKYVRDFSSPTDRGAVASAGTSVRLIAEESVYLRQGSGRKVLMVRLANGPSAASGDGTYAELWSTTW